MQPLPPPAALVSLYCVCRTPLSAVVGTPTVVCHACGVTMGVPVAPPRPPPPAVLAPHGSIRASRGGGLALLLGVIGLVGGAAGTLLAISAGQKMDRGDYRGPATPEQVASARDSLGSLFELSLIVLAAGAVLLVVGIVQRTRR